jgi:hypothetical protein
MKEKNIKVELGESQQAAYDIKWLLEYPHPFGKISNLTLIF